MAGHRKGKPEESAHTVLTLDTIRRHAKLANRNPLILPSTYRDHINFLLEEVDRSHTELAAAKPITDILTVELHGWGLDKGKNPDNEITLSLTWEALRNLRRLMRATNTRDEKETIALALSLLEEHVAFRKRGALAAFHTDEHRYEVKLPDEG